MKKILNLRKIAQPTGIKTGGSTFKNPVDQSDKKVWQLIKESVPLEKSFGDGKACDGLWKQRVKAISDAIALGSEHWGADKFGESPLVSIEGTCMRELSPFHGSLGDAFHGRSL